MDLALNESEIMGVLRGSLETAVEQNARRISEQENRELKDENRDLDIKNSELRQQIADLQKKARIFVDDPNVSDELKQRYNGRRFVAAEAASHFEVWDGSRWIRD